jgi:hypothetical protein
MEVHHFGGRGGNYPHAIENLIALWPWEHADLDPTRHLGYTFLDWVD